MNEYFESSLDLLLAELKRIELKLQLRVMSTRQDDGQTGRDEFSRLYISEREIDAIIGTPRSRREDSSSWLGNSALGALAESLKELEADIAARKKKSLRRGLVLRLHELEQLFHLSIGDTLDVTPSYLELPSEKRGSISLT